MILDSKALLDGDMTTLDDLFRRAGVRHPAALALIDPPNRESFTGGAPRRLSFSAADRAISALAARLRGLGLATDTPVAIQLPNTVESIVTLLGILRAGMVPVLLPLLWRRQEIVAALDRVGVKAIVTCARVGATAQTEIAMAVAADLFPVRFVCGFGDGLPDGVVPLDDVFGPARHELAQMPRRIGNPATHAAVVTFDIAPGRPVAVIRSHRELIDTALAIVRDGAMASDARLLSTIAVGSHAGLSLALVPWLLTGGTLSLHHSFEPATFAQQAHGQHAIVLPGPMLAPLSDARCLDGDTAVVALWRSPEQYVAATAWTGRAPLLDVETAGEAMLTARRRGADGLPVRSGDDLVRQGGIVRSGGYSFVQADVDAAVAAVDPQAVIVALPDALLGLRHAGHAADSAAVRAELEARGVNALVTAAFTQPKPVNRAQSTVAVDGLLRAAG